MLTQLFLLTTNPKTKITDLLNFKNLTIILFSVFIHTFIYILFINLFFFVFYNKICNYKINSKLFILFISIMFFGYFARLIHSKEVYRSFNYDIYETKNYLNTHYNTWFFLG